MSIGINKVIVLGNAGSDPEVRILPSGMAIATFSVAATERIKDNRGEYHERTEWVRLIAFDRRAEVVRDYVHKGTRVYAEGKLHTDSWNDKTSGEKRYRTNVVLKELLLLSFHDGGRRESENRDASPSGGDEDTHSLAGVGDDDIPF